MPSLHLIRHGRSGHRHRGWLTSAGVERWREAYDATGLAAGERAPDDARHLAERASLLVSSDMVRAVESAALLTSGGASLTSPLLREAAIPIPPLGRLPLPLALWEHVIGIPWLVSLRREPVDAPTPTRERARAAARWLEEVAAGHQSVAVVTHGAFRAYLAGALRATGWTYGPGQRSFSHWSVWTLERPGGR